MSPPSPESMRPTILAIDDTPENLSLLNAILADTYTVKVANGAVRGLAIAQGDRRPDLILLDVMMPVMDGFEVCRLLKEDPRSRGIPVIFLTGKSDAEDEERGLELGAADYITKPLNPAVVMRRIANQIALVRAQGALARQEALAAARDIDDAERDKALAQFESVVSHDVRASLSVISGYAGLLRKKCEGDEKALGFLSPIRDNAKRVTQLAAQWRETERNLRRPMRQEMLDMQSLVDEVLAEQLMTHVAEGAALRTDVGELPPAWADATAMRLVWEQLIGNALVALAGRSAPLLRIQASEVLSEVAYTVQDNGIGIGADDLPRLFTPFEHLHSEETTGEGSSSGPRTAALGLFVAHQTVRRQGGRMWAEGAAGLGATLHFSLPACRPGQSGAEGPCRPEGLA